MRRRASGDSDAMSRSKKIGTVGSRFICVPICYRKIALTPFSGVEDAQLERLADRLRAVHDVQLAQDLLHVVLHRERADLEDRADLEVRFAEVDPLQDVQLAHGEDAAAGGLVAAALRALGELRAHPRRMQRGREQLHEVRLALTRAAGPAGEDEEAGGAALGVVDAVHQELRGAQALELAREA